jgi:hypothetical protein
MTGLFYEASSAAFPTGFRIPRLSRRWHPALGVGQSEDFAMTHKSATFKFVIWTTIAVALGIMTWSGAAKRSPSIGQARTKQAAAISPEIAELPNLQLSRVRLLVSNLN